MKNNTCQLTAPHSAIVWGKSKGGHMQHISEVDSGKECGCICEGCGDALIARKGKVNVHHFAHTSKDEIRSCGESTLHKAAKQVLAETLLVSLPDKKISLAEIDILGKEHRIEEVLETREFVARKCGIEVTRSDYRPDITFEHANGEVIDIEILVTHEVGVLKRDHVKQQSSYSMIEIDLSDWRGRALEPKQLKELVCYEAPREWIFENRVSATETSLKRVFKKSILKLTEMKAQLETDNKIELRNAKIEIQKRISKQLEDSYNNRVEDLKYSLKEVRRENHYLKDVVNSKQWIVAGGDVFTLVGFKLVPCYSELQDAPLYCKLSALRRPSASGTNHILKGYQPVVYEVHESVIDTLLQLSYPTVAKLQFGTDLECGSLRVIGIEVDSSEI